MRKRPRLGLILHGIAYSYQESILRGADEECRAQGADLFCFSGGSINDGAVTNRTYDVISPGSLDGVLVSLGTMGTVAGTPAFDEFRKRFGDVPWCSLGYREPNAISILVDSASTVEVITKHLATEHHRTRIAFIEGNSQESDERKEAYLRGLASCNLKVNPELIFPGNYTWDSGADAVEKLVEGDSCRADAIVAANDWMALAAMKTLEKKGIRVPDQVAVVGFDDVDQARFELPSLTTIRQPTEQLGVHGVRAVLAASRGEPTERLIVLQTQVQLRKSCGCFSGALTPVRQNTTPAEGEQLAHRADVVTAAAPDFGRKLAPTWGRDLVVALDADLAANDTHRFETLLERFIAETSSLGNAAAWHHVVSALRAQVEDSDNTKETLRHASQLFDAAQVLVSAHAERIQGTRRLAKEALLQALTQLSEGLRAASSHQEIRSVLLDHLPGLRVPALNITVHEGDLNDKSRARIVMAYDAERGIVSSDGAEMTMGDFLPPQLNLERRSTWIAAIASFRDEVLGYTMLETSDIETPRYDSIREQIGIALNAVRLLNAVVEEATRRERAERERLASELELAKRIQTGILPRSVEVPGLQIATFMEPATEVGGDYFDVQTTPHGAWLSIGDVAGHGLPTGLVMLMIQSSFAALTSHRGDAPPSELWAHLNEVLAENVRRRLEQDEHATLTLLRYDGAGRFVFAGAHEDIVIWRKATGKIELIATPGVWAGISAKLPAGATEDNQLQLEPGDLMLLYTDGIVEAQNDDHEMYGLDRVCNELASVATQPVEAITEHLVARANAWMSRQDDDITLVVTRYTGSESGSE